MRHQLFTDFYGERKEGKKGEKKVNAMTLAEQPFLSRQGGGGNIIHVPGNIPGIHVCPVTWEPERRTGGNVRRYRPGVGLSVFEL